ncbi:MAG: alpha-amylase [Candidatus Lokiarchaeota archaeon]|nr:alpha-amylase [Candidatus Lokiarchaeota archaeon]
MEHPNYIPDWAKNGIIYHIYPLGFFDAPYNSQDESEVVNRLERLRKYYDYLQELGITIIQFGPIFESVSHGYDTTDYLKIDRRLGTNELFKEIVEELHQLGMKIIVDGVFNHVGRDFFSFRDVKDHKQNSSKQGWHFIDFTQSHLNPYLDGFDYKNWEGHHSLVKLNLKNQEVREFLFNVARYWLRDIGIDGWRLDVAYLIDNDFLREFKKVCKSVKSDSVLVGELIHNPYSKWIGPDLLDAGTGYQVYKSIYNSINENNFWELKSVLEQSFHPQWGQNRKILLMNFLGNHDVTRIRSNLKDERHVIPAFLILFTLYGIPKIYYGDEFGMKGIVIPFKSDRGVRGPMSPLSTKWDPLGKAIHENIKRFIQLRKKQHALIHGNIIPVWADNTKSNMIAYLRKSSKQTILVVVSTSYEVKKVKIPLWNLHLEGAVFRDLLNDFEEYNVRNNYLELDTEGCWGKVLERII